MKDKILISKKDFDFLIFMAGQGCDEQCGENYNICFGKLDEIRELYKE